MPTFTTVVFDLDALIDARSSALFEGVWKTLAKLKFKKVQTCVVTTHTKEKTQEIIDQTGLTSFFENAMITLEDTGGAWPNLLLLELRRLKADRRFSVMMCDTDRYIEVGKKANLRTIGVTYGLGKDSRNIEPDMSIDAFPEIMRIIS